MGNLKITDLVDQKALDDLKSLNESLTTAKNDYAEAAKELAKGLKIKIEGLDDLERLQTIIVTNVQKADTAAQKMNATIEEQNKVVKQTTNEISRELASIEKENKAKREQYEQNKKALDVAHELLGTQQQNMRQLAILNNDLKKNAEAQKKLNEAEKDGTIGVEDMIARRAELLSEEKKLKTAKAELNKVISNEEKMNQAAEGSYKKLSLQLEILKKAYKELNEEEKAGTNGQILSNEISELDAHLKDLAADMGEFQRNVGNYAIAQSNYTNSIKQQVFSIMGVSEETGESLMSLAENGSKGFSELKEKVSAFGSALFGLLKNPKVVALLGIGGTAIAFKWLYDYNKGIAEATRLTQQFTKAQGEELSNQREEVQALADKYGKDFKETIIAINAVSNQFGISFDEAFSKVKDGFIAGADVNEEFIDNLKEYPAYFKEAGISASEFIAITAQANQAGIYSDKGIDIIKEGNLRIREMTSATEEAMKGIGMNTDKIKKDLEAGLISTFDVIQMVSAKLETLPPTSAKVGTAIADIFGGPGEDAGLEYILTLKDIDTNLDNVKAKAGELAVLEEEELNAQIELQKAVADVFDITGGTFEKVTASIKIGFMKALTGLLHIFKSLINFVKEHRTAMSMLGAVVLTVTAYVNAHNVALALMWTRTKAVALAQLMLNKVMAGAKAIMLLATTVFKLLTLNLKGATISMRAFNMAIKANPLGILLTVITAVISSITLFSTKANAATRSFKKMAAGAESMARIQKKANDSTQEEVVRIKRLTDIVNDSASSYDKKKKALLELQRIVPNFHASLGKELKLTENNTKAIGAYITQLGNKAKAEAYYDELIDINKRLKEAKRVERQKRTNIYHVNKAIESRPDLYGSKRGNVSIGMMSSAGATWTNDAFGERNTKLLEKLEERRVHEKALEKAIADRTKAEKDLQAITKELESDKAVLSFFDALVLGDKGSDYSGGGGGDQGGDDYRKKILEALQQSELDLMDEGYAKGLLMMKTAHEKKMKEITGNSKEEIALRKNLTEIYNKELASYELAYNEQRAKLDLKNKLDGVEKDSQEELDIKLSLMDIDREAEIRAAKKTGADVSDIEEKYNAKRLALKQDFAKKRITIIQSQYSADELQANVAFIKEQAELGRMYAEGLISKEEYEQKKLELSEKYALESSNRTIEMLQKQLDVENLTDEQRKEIMDKLVMAKANQEKMIADNMISESERQKQADDELTKKRLDNVKKILDFTSQAFNAINGLVSAVYDGQIAKLEEQADANEEAYDKEIERIENLEESGVITKEEAEERKRAAEAKTQAKNEEIEQQKRKAQHKQAVWNKANQLAQTGIATARGIMEAFAQAGPFAGPAMAALVAALGAIQAATIIATPIPKYAKGTDNHPGGLAIVGDGGKREVVMVDGMAYMTSDKPTLVNLPRGAEVIPDAGLLDAAKVLQGVGSVGGSGFSPNVVVNNDFSELARIGRDNFRMLRLLISQQRYIANKQEYSRYKDKI